MTNRDQDGVFDSRQSDLPGMAVANGFVPRHKGKDIMYESSEVAIGTVVEKFRTGYGQRQ
jgi:hypothetical protein